MSKKYYEESVLYAGYSICWAGRKNNLVYTAWFKNDAIGYFRDGSMSERKNLARLCCRDNFLQNKKAS